MAMSELRHLRSSYNGININNNSSIQLCFLKHNELRLSQVSTHLRHHHHTLVETDKCGPFTDDYCCHRLYDIDNSIDNFSEIKDNSVKTMNFMKTSNMNYITIM